MNRIRKAALALSGLVAATTLVIWPSSQPANAAVACHTSWGSQAKTSGPMATDRVTGVAAGRHTCFDQLSIYLNGATAPGYNARYVNRCVADGSGQVRSVRGGAILAVAIKSPATAGFPANRAELVSVGGFNAFRQVRSVGNFEGITSICVGVRGRLPFRMIKTHLANGKAVDVLQVAHSWK